MKHLDIGCGLSPKNPFGAAELYGCDIGMEITSLGSNFKCANLAIDPIPFVDSTFDTVSAFDFIEHIPRQIVDLISKTTKLPFIDLMVEIHRVLKPGGIFYACTPVYPHKEAFQDPTHVNFITMDTHKYFSGKWPLARPYGFNANFDVVSIEKMVSVYAYSAKRPFSVLAKNIIKSYLIPHVVSHVVWTLRAVK